MDQNRPSYEELEARLAEAGQVIEALRRAEVDAIVGQDEPLMVRLRAAEAESERLLLAIDTAAEAINVTSADGLMTYTNPAMDKLFGYERGELLGKSPAVLNAGPDPVGGMKSIMTAVERSGIWEGELRNRKKDGTKFLSYARISALKDKDGRILQFVSTQHDITEHRALEAQLRQAQRLEAVGTLAGGVAHEVNNPISGIMNYAQLIKDQLKGQNETVQEFAGEIIRESRRVAAIVRNLLTFSHPDEQQPGSARLSDLVHTCVSLIQTVMHQDQIVLELDVPEDLPTLECRTQQIQQVIMNLLTNARDALNEKYPGYHEDKIIRLSATALGPADSRGGPMSSAAADQTRTAAEDIGPPHSPNPKPWVRIAVEDHGPGIPEDVRERLFDPFYTTKRPDRGMGLGLSVAYAVIKDHGGNLTVESEAGKWTRFHVDLPLGDGGRKEGGEAFQ